MKVACVVFDCASPEPLARWWQGLVGGEVELDADGDAVLRRPGEARLDFIRVPEGKVVKNRLHLDLETSDYGADVARAEAHGAVPATDLYVGPHFSVFRDPEGNEFCLLRAGWDHPRS